MTTDPTEAAAIAQEAVDGGHIDQATLDASNRDNATFDGTPTRQCIGSARYGIAPHVAALADFPLQPSQKDGIGRMCKPHWKTYVASLDRDRRAAKEAGEGVPVAVEITPRGRRSIERQAQEQAADPKLPARERKKAAANAAMDASSQAIAKARRAPKPAPVVEPDPALLAARDLLARIDAMPASEATAAYATDEAQAALELVGRANGNGHGKRGAVADLEPVEAETPLGETVDAGAEEADPLTAADERMAAEDSLRYDD